MGFGHALMIPASILITKQCVVIEHVCCTQFPNTLRVTGGFILILVNKYKFRITDKTSDQNAIYALLEGHHERINTTTQRAI
jgi:hypothetical protein